MEVYDQDVTQVKLEGWQVETPLLRVKHFLNLKKCPMLQTSPFLWFMFLLAVT